MQSGQASVSTLNRDLLLSAVLIPLGPAARLGDVATQGLEGMSESFMCVWMHGSMFTCVCVSMHTHTHVRGGRDPDQRAIDFHKVKECSNCLTILLILHASKIMHKILQVRLQQYMSRELPEVQAGFRKGRGSRDQIANIHWITEKKKKTKGIPEKHLLLLHWLC